MGASIFSKLIFADDTYTFYRNDGANNFTDATIDTGLAVNTRYLGWGTAAIDFDNDGWKDLILANGHVYPEVESGHLGERFKQKRLLYWNRGDKQFFDLSAQAGSGITAEHASRGLAVGDLDNDGKEKIVIVNIGEAPVAAEEHGSRQLGRSILIATRADCDGAQHNRCARHCDGQDGQTQMDKVAAAAVRISRRTIYSLHFGLGKAAAANVTVPAGWMARRRAFPRSGGAAGCDHPGRQGNR